MLHGDLRGVLDLGVGGAERGGEAGGGHGAGDADLALAAHLGPRDRGAGLVEGPDGRGGEQEGAPRLGCSAVEAVVVAQHRGQQAGCAIGGGGDNPPSGGVLLVHGQGPEVHPVQGRQGIGETLVGVTGEAPQHLGRTPVDLQAPRQHAIGARAAVDAGVHGLHDLIEPGRDLRVRAQDALVGQHQLGDGQARGGRLAQQFGGGGVGVGDLGPRLPGRVLAHLVLVAHKAAADGEVETFAQRPPLGVEGLELQGIRVLGQAGAAFPDQVLRHVERDFAPAAER